jgi:DNA processing protein
MTVTSQIITMLLQLPGVGRKGVHNALTAHKGLLSASSPEQASKSIALKLNPRLTSAALTTAIDAGHAILEESTKLGIHMVSFFDPDFPASLKKIPDPPVLLNYKGELSALTTSVAVIGTREPSELGQSAARQVGAALAGEGVTVVNGLALGCDAEALLGCLGEKGRAAAILAHGLNQISPKKNATLASQVLAGGGTLLSEYFVGQTARPGFFVERDRLQAGLTECVFVVETDTAGGTMHTARFARQYGRKVFVLDHPLDRRQEEKARGNRLLIEQHSAFPIRITDLRSFLTAVTSRHAQVIRHSII